MEIMCEYFDCGYKILYNFGETEIKNSVDLVKFIEGLLKGNNKVIIAVGMFTAKELGQYFILLTSYQTTSSAKIYYLF